MEILSVKSTTDNNLQSFAQNLQKEKKKMIWANGKVETSDGNNLLYTEKGLRESNS